MNEEDTIDEDTIPETANATTSIPTPPQEFKVGDYLIQMVGGDSYGHNLVIVTSIINNSINHRHIRSGSNGNSGIEDFRYATQEEIANEGEIIKLPEGIEVGAKVIVNNKCMSHYNQIGRITRIEEYMLHIVWESDNRSTTTDRHDYLTVVKCPYTTIACTKCVTPCPSEIEVREQKRIAEEKLKQIEIENAKYKKTITISQTLHKYLKIELKEWHNIKSTYGDRDYPFMYALGQNSDGIITQAIPLRGQGGCKDMQHITPYELSMSYIKLAKKKLMMVGVARVGKFYSLDTYIGNNDKTTISIAMNNEKIWTYSYITELGRHIYHDLQINKQTKGGEKNGKSKSEESGSKEDGAKISQ